MMLHLAENRARWLPLLVAALAIVPAPARACSVPVFRYALERWSADLYEIDLFYREALPPELRRHVDRLASHATFNGGRANFEVVRVDLDGQPDADLVELWSSLGEPPLPYAVVRLPLPRGQRAVIWQGAIGELSAALFDSPARREIGRRLLTGDSVVWVLLGDPGSKPIKQAMEQLGAQLPLLAEEVLLPAGVGQPGSELMSSVPLAIRFSSLIVNDDDSDEVWLARMLRCQAPTTAAADEPLVAAVFGRARVMEVFRASDLEQQLVADISRFLCGACSCQVKQLNPGFDLLIGASWEEQLFAEGEPPQASAEPSRLAAISAAMPLEVPIPPGRPAPQAETIAQRADAPQAANAASTRPSSSGPRTTSHAAQTWIWLGGAVVGLMATAAALLLRRQRRSAER